MTPEELAKVDRGSVVAAAGCGKTDLIARTVACSTGRQLILTHTNAGVEALRRRLRRIGVAQDRFGVDTIAGWCLKYIVAYPGRSGGVPMNAEGFADWGAIYPAMTALLQNATVRTVVQASYSGAFVDEYQDCDEAQHRLISQLADLLPVRILGDPLQAVFRFAGEPPPWRSTVEARFPGVGALTTPWRWRRPGENRPLGDWLGEVRNSLERQRAIDLTNPCIQFLQTPAAWNWKDAAVHACFEATRSEESSVAIMKWGKGEFLLLGQSTGGFYQCVEPIDAKDAAAWLTGLESAPLGARTAHLWSFLRIVAVHVEEGVAVVEASQASGAEPDRVVQILRQVDQGGSPAVAAEALDAMARLAPIRVFRRELLWAVIDSLRDADKEGYLNLKDALRRRRNLTSHIGRRLARRTVGSTLLLKGMEFDHAIVVNTGKFTVNDLYVALTRASKSLTVLSAQPTVDPRTLPTK